MTTHGNNRDDATEAVPDRATAPLSERLDVEGDPDTGDFIPGPNPIDRDEDAAEELAEEAYGDKDDDGNPDVPHIPLSG
jgi:hypothetical protein